MNWEKGHTEPPVLAMPAIFKFLGYDPFPKPKTLSEQLLAKRRKTGWSIREAARLASVDPGTWANWERGRLVLLHRHRIRIAKILDLSIETLNQEMTARWGCLHKRRS